MCRKSACVSAAFNSCRSGLVESVVESCGMCFPQLVEAVFRVRQVFHGFFHKLLFSTPQTFHFSRVEKAFHFSGNFPQAVCGKDLPEIPRRICGFHFSRASIITTIYSFLCILSFFAASLQKTADNMCCAQWMDSKKLSVIQLQKQEKRLELRDVFLSAKWLQKDNRKDIGQHRYKTDIALSGTHVSNPIQN